MGQDRGTSLLPIATQTTLPSQGANNNRGRAVHQQELQQYSATKDRAANKQGLQQYSAILFSMATPVHFAASLLTALLYVLFAGQAFPAWSAPVIGSITIYLVFLVVALFCKSQATAEQAHRRSYGLLNIRIFQLGARLTEIRHLKLQEDSRLKEAIAKQEALKDHKTSRLQEIFKPQRALKPEDCIRLQSTWPEYRQVALQEATICYDEVQRYLREQGSGMLWVTRVGYLNAWSMVHRAEEALVKVEPLEMVLRGALHDKLAIQKAKIKNRDDLIKQLDSARIDIEKHLFNQDHHLLRLSQHPQNDAQIEHARIVLSEIRRNLNDFRDRFWEGLIRERNRLLLVMNTTALLTHFLLVIAIIMGQPVPSILTGAVAFYIVGAIAGLFGRLYNESIRKSYGVDDYGLSHIRLVATLLLSGLAGIAGVLVTIILYTSLLLPTITNTTNTSTGGNVTQTPQITVEEIFRPNEPSYLLTAAVFGLAPNLVIAGLQQRTQRYAYNLKESKGGSEESDDEDQ